VVLVIDDDEDLCESLWDILRERCYRVCLAHDLPQAAARIQEQDYNVALIDMKLPQGDGAAVFRMVRQTSNREQKTLSRADFMGRFRPSVRA